MVDQWHIVGAAPQPSRSEDTQSGCASNLGRYRSFVSLYYVLWIETNGQNPAGEVILQKQPNFRQTYPGVKVPPPTGVLRPESGKLSRAILYGSISFRVHVRSSEVCSHTHLPNEKSVKSGHLMDSRPH